MVTVATRENMNDYTFFYSEPSVWGYKCWNPFCLSDATAFKRRQWMDNLSSPLSCCLSLPRRITQAKTLLPWVAVSMNTHHNVGVLSCTMRAFCLHFWPAAVWNGQLHKKPIGASKWLDSHKYCLFYSIELITTTAEWLERIFSRAGPKFEDLEGSVMIFIKALHDQQSSSFVFCSYFTDSYVDLASPQLGMIATFGCASERSEMDMVLFVPTRRILLLWQMRNPAEHRKSLISSALYFKSIGSLSYFLLGCI